MGEHFNNSDELAPKQRFKERGQSLSGRRKGRRGLPKRAGRSRREPRGSSGSARVGRTLGFPLKNKPSK